MTGKEISNNLNLLDPVTSSLALFIIVDFYNGQHQISSFLVPDDHKGRKTFHLMMIWRQHIFQTFFAQTYNNLTDSINTIVCLFLSLSTLLDVYFSSQSGIWYKRSIQFLRTNSLSFIRFLLLKVPAI